MVKLKRHKTGWVVVVENPDGEAFVVDLSCFQILERDAESFLQSVVRIASGKRPASVLSKLREFRQFGVFLQRHNVTRLPTGSSEWQSLLSEYFEFALTRSDSKAKLKTRAQSWTRVVAPIFEKLRDIEDVIPLSCEIPTIPYRLDASELADASDSTLADDFSDEPETELDRLLIGISLSRTDAEYLDEVREALLHRRKLLHGLLFSWWAQVDAHFGYGQALIRGSDQSVLGKRLKAKDYYIGKGQGRTHFANGQDAVSLGFLLSMLVARDNGLFGKDILERSACYPSLSTIGVPADCPATISSLVSKTDRLNWMLGNLSNFDIAVALALLIMHNPRFTPWALLRARLRTGGGRIFLDIEDYGPVLRIEKGRAKEIKESELDDESLRVFDSLLKMSQHLRPALMKTKPKLSTLLFLGSQGGRVVSPNASRISGELSRIRDTQDGRRPVLFEHFPELKRAGFGSGVTLSKIRATEGVLVWFKTGSITEMARALGNSTKTVLTYYLPEPLLVAWNTRLVRRFQNLWLAIASSGESFAVDATDFSSATELTAFIREMLDQHPAGSSPLSKELHRAFGSRVSDKSRDSQSGVLTIPISKESLTLLYLYQECALSSGVDLSRLANADGTNDVSPRQLVDLAELLRHELPHSREHKHRQIHEEASKEVPVLIKRVDWSNLFVKRYGLANAP